MLRRLAPFSVTLWIVALVALLKYFLFAVMHIDSPVLLFFSAIALAAWYGGLVQGLFAIVLSLCFILLYLYDLSRLSFTLDDWSIRLVLLTVDGLVISLVCAKMHREAAKALQASREKQVANHRLEKIFASDMIGLVFSNFDGRMLDANDYFINLMQISRSELKAGALSWQMFTPPEHLERSLQALKEVRATGGAKPFEKEYLRRDGSRIICSVAVSVVDEHTVVAYILDITTSKRAQLARLSESQIFLDSVVENIPNMIFVKDAKDLRFVRFNKAGEQLLGLDSDQLLGRNDYDFFPREQADAFVLADRAVIEGGQVVDIPEEPIATPQGQRLLHTKKIPVFDSEGRAQYLLGISEDITEKKKNEGQKIKLLQSEVARAEAEKTVQRLGFLTEAGTALSRSLDIQVMLNSFARTLLREMASTCVIDLLDDKGLSFERLAVTRLAMDPTVATAPLATAPAGPTEPVVRSQIIADFLKYQIPLDRHEGVALSLRSGRVQLYHHLSDEVVNRALLSDATLTAAIRAHGARSLLIVPILYHTKVLGAISLLAPGPDRVYDDLDLSVAQELAKRAAFAIENASLYSRAAEANRTKSAFLANISHEIRTPLGAMIGFAELSLEEKDLSPQQQEYIQKIAKNGQQLLRIVNDVLDISKVESDRILVEKVDFSLTKLLEDVTSLLQIQAESKGLRLSLSKAPDLPTRICTDPLRLRQILINMIGNAIKFTEKGGVEVKAEYCETPHGQLCFLIQDTGMGIDAEQADRLFEPFVQVDESMARKFGGTGLGLFLSRKLARLLGGDVELESSQLGQGSTFRISIEAAPAQKDVSEINAEATENLLKTLPRQNRLRGRILVVEDSPDNQTLIQAFLQNENVDIEVANNGREGVELAQTTPYDLILMDIQMPVMDGFEAIHHLRQQGYRGHVVALTAHGMKGDRERCLGQGFDDYLCKPISRQALAECVSKNLEL